MVATRQTMAADLIAAGLDKDQARAIATAFGKVFEKQATDEYLNYRAIEESFGGGNRWGTIVIGPAGSTDADVVYAGDLGVSINEAYAEVLAINASGYGQIVILEGSYAGGTIPTLGGNVSIRGMGPTSTIISLSSPGVYLSNVGSVEDIGFTGSSGSCLFGVSHVHNCNFFATGGDTGWFDVCIELCALVDNCYFINLPGAVPQGVGAKGCQQVIGCIFVGFSNGVLDDLTGTNTGYVTAGNTFLDCTTGIKVTGQHFLVSSNTFWIPDVATPNACVELTAASDHNYVVANWDIEYAITDAGVGNVVGPNASDGSGGGGSTNDVEVAAAMSGMGIQQADETLYRNTTDTSLAFITTPIQQADFLALQLLVTSIGDVTTQLSMTGPGVQQAAFTNLSNIVNDIVTQVDMMMAGSVQPADFAALQFQVASMDPDPRGIVPVQQPDFQALQLQVAGLGAIDPMPGVVPVQQADFTVVQSVLAELVVNDKMAGVVPVQQATFAALQLLVSDLANSTGVSGGFVPVQQADFIALQLLVASLGAVDPMPGVVPVQQAQHVLDFNDLQVQIAMGA